MAAIRFGTDGWRAVIADDFTFENLTTVTHATAQWLRANFGEAPRVALGFDTRFLGRRFAEHAARVLAASGVHVLFGKTFTATPAVSWATKAFSCDAGVVITASHNPPSYNGFKIKANVGGPASPEMIAAVEAELDRLGPLPTVGAFADYVGEGRIEERDLRAEYLDMLRGRIDVSAIRASGLTVVHDAMYGAGFGMIRDLLGDGVVELRSDWNPGMMGGAPEPIERNLGALAQSVVRTAAAAGIANDGDADRIGMYDETGAFVDSHRLLALLTKYLYTEQGLRGDVVKTFSTTSMLDRMGEQYGLTVQTTPIGFKYIGPRIVDGDVLVGGEESGGMAVKGHIPERDGIYIGLLILEMMVRRGRKLSELVQELFDEFGPHVCRRIDAHTTSEKKQAILDRLTTGGLETIRGKEVTRVETLDGFKHFTEEGWLLVRPSGTEPVLRVYSEAKDAETAEALIADAVEQLGVDGAH